MEEKKTLQLMHNRFNFSDEATNLSDKPEALAISQTPAGVNDELAVREVFASRATRPPLNLKRGSTSVISPPLWCLATLLLSH